MSRPTQTKDSRLARIQVSLGKLSVIMNMTTGTSRSNVAVMGERPWVICEPNITELLLEVSAGKG